MTADPDMGAVGGCERSRSEVLARHGIVATSQPLAAQAGLRMLQEGGTAADAAVAGAAALAVVEPNSTGLGGDLFAIHRSARDGTLYGINASGWAPKAWTPDPLAPIPETGVHSISVPGAVDGMARLQERFGTLGFARVLEPAAELAEEGFAMTEVIHGQWQDAGEPAERYGIVENPELGRALRLLQEHGTGAFYDGEIGRAIVARIGELGGTMTIDDLREFESEWVEPISTSYRGYDVHELPPNTQGFAVLEMLNLLEPHDLAGLGPRSPQHWHLLVEAKKLAYADLERHNADPRFADVPVERLISKAHAATLRLDPSRASETTAGARSGGGTIALMAGDRWGNMISLISSVFTGFGSRVAVPGYGFVLHNRASLFSLDPDHPNVVAPRKRPFHTLVPGFVTRDGEPVLAFGTPGGSGQPQSHVALLVNLFDHGMNVQAAVDAARFVHDQATNVLTLEAPLYEQVGPQLAAMGHEVRPGGAIGGLQAIHYTPATGVYRGGSDPRKDGQAVGW